MAYVKVRQGNTQEEREQNVAYAVNLLKLKVKREGIMKRYFEKQYFTKPSVLNKLKRERKLYLSRKNADRW